MEILYQNNEYAPDIDVLVRAYPNQSEDVDDDKAFAGEVLFKPHMQREHVRFTAPFPRGLAEGAAKTLGELKNLGVKIQVSNELPGTVGQLNYCNQHFDIRFKECLEKNGIK